jgi:hypothetical protein
MTLGLIIFYPSVPALVFFAAEMTRMLEVWASTWIISHHATLQFKLHICFMFFKLHQAHPKATQKSSTQNPRRSKD